MSQTCTSVVAGNPVPRIMNRQPHFKNTSNENMNINAKHGTEGERKNDRDLLTDNYNA